ncbi:MAG TPA: YciI family protein [Acidimicrobiales bacterium]|nr:YciI family protein [Acidimicrobiales bacterium]
MAKYALAYTGGSMSEDEEERRAVMAAWGAWFDSIGDGVVDAGNPFGTSASVSADGTVRDGAPSELSGYSIISADSLAEAADLAKRCPVLHGGGSVEVYEIVPVM